MTEVRLQKFLASAGVASRRKAEDIISSGRVTVNGKVVSELGTKINPSADSVRLDGRLLKLNEKKLYLFHKPSGVITTAHDPFGRATVAGFVKHLPVRVFPVGRLDSDVRGLLLLTNDGDYAQRLLHPSFEVPRGYLAVVKGEPTEIALRRLTTGVSLEDGPGKFESASISTDTMAIRNHFGKISREYSVIELVATEGRNHFVKRMCEAIGHPVVDLVRVFYGEFRLGNLATGKIVEVPIPGASDDERTASANFDSEDADFEMAKQPRRLQVGLKRA